MRVQIVLAFGLVLSMAHLGCDRAHMRDGSISSEVEEDFEEARLPDTIDVETNDGVVTLSGTVPDVQNKVTAGAMASKVVGVARVVNNLRVTMAGDAPPLPADRGVPAPRQLPPGDGGVMPPAVQPNP